MDEKSHEIAHCHIVARKPKTRGIQSKLAIRHGHVPALYLATAMALQGMTKQELEALKLRIEDKAAIQKVMN
jgi:hypothetical protein